MTAPPCAHGPWHLGLCGPGFRAGTSKDVDVGNGCISDLTAHYAGKQKTRTRLAHTMHVHDETCVNMHGEFLAWYSYQAIPRYFQTSRATCQGAIN
eukprot:353090-Chlamydomonas_euryale.AAC.8